jgi:heme-degrading monooxygenase HmoA
LPKSRRYARIITMKAKPGKGDEFVRKFRDDVASTAVDIDGLRKLFLLRSEDDKDDLVAISIWDGEDSAKNYVKSGRNNAYADRLAAVQKGKERVRGYHLAVDVEGEELRKRRPN